MFCTNKKEADSFLGKALISASEIDWNKIDLLVIATQKYFEEIQSELKKNIEFIYNQKKIVSLSDFLEAYMPYKSAEVFGKSSISYIYSRSDTCVGPSMNGGVNFAEDSIKTFLN